MSIPKRIVSAVAARDERRCTFLIDGRRSCGRRTDLFVEQRLGVPDFMPHPEDFQVVCLYHLRDGCGLDFVDWCHAGRA
jgi:hypothetical protein